MQLGSQVKFINTIKYYNQSISSLAKSVDYLSSEKRVISYEKIKSHKDLNMCT